MCVGRDLDSQAPNIITLLLNLHTAAAGAADRSPLWEPLPGYLGSLM